MPDGIRLSPIRRAQRKLRELERFATPNDLIAAVDVAARQGDIALTRLLASSEAVKALNGAGPISELTLVSSNKGARLYSHSARPGRRLIIGFTGRAFRLMMPLPIFIQALPQDVDLLLLQDAEHNHYRRRIFDGETDFSQLPSKLRPIIAPYKDVITIGASGGGLPAVRLAKAAGLRRAFSFGGRTIDDTLRIIRGEDVSSAYDPLCCCDTRYRTEAIFVYSANHVHDRRAAITASTCANSHLLPLQEQSTHGVLWTLSAMGRLDTFLSIAFDGSAAFIKNTILSWNADELAAGSRDVLRGADPIPRQYGQPGKLSASPTILAS